MALWSLTRSEKQKQLKHLEYEEWETWHCDDLTKKERMTKVMDIKEYDQSALGFVMISQRD